VDSTRLTSEDRAAVPQESSPNTERAILSGVENCRRMELADMRLAAKEYVGSGSITTMDPEKAGELREKYAVGGTHRSAAGDNDIRLLACRSVRALHPRAAHLDHLGKASRSSPELRLSQCVQASAEVPNSRHHEKAQTRTELFKAHCGRHQIWRKAAGGGVRATTPRATRRSNVYRLLVHDKIITPMPEERWLRKRAHRLALWYAHSTAEGSPAVGLTAAWMSACLSFVDPAATQHRAFGLTLIKLVGSIVWLV